MFVRKRDPRHKSHLAHQARLNQTKASGSLAPSGPKSMTRKAQANNTPYVEQEWQKVTKDHQHDDLEWAAGEGEDSEEWECVVCGKSFKSEAAWDSHERSKKHMKEIERLKREMTRENEELGLSGEGRDEDDGLGYVVEVDGNAVPQPPPTLAEQIQGDDSGSETLDVLDEFVSEESPKNGEQLQVDQVEGLDMQPPEIVSASPELSKKEKRRLREARKVQVAQAERNTAQVSCFVYCKLCPHC
jgi:DnaJ family protein A protein 5